MILPFQHPIEIRRHTPPDVAFKRQACNLRQPLWKSCENEELAHFSDRDAELDHRRYQISDLDRRYE